MIRWLQQFSKFYDWNQLWWFLYFCGIFVFFKVIIMIGRHHG